MNIADILNGMKKEGENTLVTKLQIRSESRKIDQRSDDFANQVICWLTEEIKYISNNLTYGGCPTQTALSDEDKKLLLDKLEEAAKSIPEKIKKQLDEIYSDAEEEKEEKEADKTHEVKQVEIEVQPANVSAQTVPTFSQFGY